jgi:hypothetical protein
MSFKMLPSLIERRRRMNTETRIGRADEAKSIPKMLATTQFRISAPPVLFLKT